MAHKTGFEDQKGLLRTGLVAVGAALAGAAVAAVYCRQKPEETQKPEEAQKPKQLSSQDKLRNFRETDVFVLDNSLRETTVASVYGHTIEGKYKILNAVKEAGMKNMIVGAFGPTRRVDEGFIQSLKDTNAMSNKDENYYAFSEFRDASDAPWFEGARKVTNASDQTIDVPYGLSVCQNLGIPNAVIEVDIMSLWDKEGGVTKLCSEMGERTLWCKEKPSPSPSLSWAINHALVLTLTLVQGQSHPANEGLTGPLQPQV